MKYTTDNYEVVLLSETRGYFEHLRLGDELGGGLWIENDELFDYDGVYCLPEEVLSVLETAGVNVDEVRKAQEA